MNCGVASSANVVSPTPHTQTCAYLNLTFVFYYLFWSFHQTFELIFQVSKCPNTSTLLAFTIPCFCTNLPFLLRFLSYVANVHEYIILALLPSKQWPYTYIVHTYYTSTYVVFSLHAWRHPLLFFLTICSCSCSHFILHYRFHVHTWLG